MGAHTSAKERLDRRRVRAQVLQIGLEALVEALGFGGLDGVIEQLLVEHGGLGVDCAAMGWED